MKKPSKAKSAWWLACAAGTVCSKCEAAPSAKFPGWHSDLCVGCWKKYAGRPR